MNRDMELKTDGKNIPLRNFFKNPEKTLYRISPDGKHISFLAPYENRMNIFVQKVGIADSKRITSVTERDIAAHFWKNDGTILFVRDNNGDENFHLFSVDINGEKARDLTPFDGVKVDIVDELEDFETDILIQMNKLNPQVFDAYRVNIETGEMKLAAKNPGNVSQWVTDHDGRIRIAITTDGVNTAMLYRDTEEDDFKTVLTTSFKEALMPLFFTFDNKFIYASSNLGRDKSAIVKCDPSNAKELEVLFEHPEVDVNNLRFSRKRKVLTFISYTTWKREMNFLDDQMEKIYESFEKQLSGYEVIIVDNSKNEDLFVLRTYSDRSLGSHYIYDKNTDALSKLSDVSPWLEENELSEMQPVSFTSRDGLTIHGYLTLPSGAEHKNLPVVVNPHGGPWSRDVWTYNPEVQFLASRGYAVLQMNFRGSTGYGKKFWELGFKEWGRKMQDDVSDGVQWLIEQGIADPKKIAIYGASYGGYAVLAGLVFTPELYACGVDYVGVSNLFTFMKSIPEYWKPYLETLHEMVGDPVKEKELLEAGSPVFHSDKIKAPLLIAQGRMDPRVNVSESDQMVEALKKRGIDVPYMVKDDEGHGFHNEENRFEFYEAMENFLAKYLK